VKEEKPEEKISMEELVEREVSVCVCVCVWARVWPNTVSDILFTERAAGHFR